MPHSSRHPSKPSIGLGSPLAQAAWQPSEYDMRVERLRFLFSLNTMHAFIGVMLAFTVTVGYYLESAHPLIFLWLLAYAGAAAYRLLLGWRFKRLEPHALVNYVAWELMHTAGLLATGLLWGALFVGVLPTTAELTYLVLTLGVGVAIGAIPVVGALPVSYFALCAPLVGGALYLSWQSPYTHRNWMMALIGILLIGAVGVYRSYLTILHQNIRYRLLNGRLSAEMMAAHEDPTAGVLRVLKGEVRYANERMAALTGQSVDALSHSSLNAILGPGPWSDPNWISLRQGVEQGVPNTFTWQLPNGLAGPQPVQVRVRGVWEFAESHGSVLLFTALSTAQRYSTMAESDSLPVLLPSYDDWIKFARREFRKRSSYQSALVVIAAEDPSYTGWQSALADQLLARMLPREALCVRGHQVLVWLSMAARDLNAEQLRVAFRDVLAPFSTGGSALHAGTLIVDTTLDIDEAVRMAEVRAQPQE